MPILTRRGLREKSVRYDGCFVVISKDGSEWVMVTHKGLEYREFSDVLKASLGDRSIR